MKNLRLDDIEMHDIRFPVSAKRVRKGVEKTDFDPDYSGIYVIIKTNEKNYQGYGIASFVREGLDYTKLSKIVKNMFYHFLKNQTTTRLYTKLGKIWKMLSSEKVCWSIKLKNLNYLRPAAIAIINALWDLWARIEEKPVWKLLTDMTSQEFLTTIDFSNVMDVITPKEAIEMLANKEQFKEYHERFLKKEGCFATATGIGYYNNQSKNGHTYQRIHDLCRNFKKLGFITFEVHADPMLQDSVKRCCVISNMIGKTIKKTIEKSTRTEQWTKQKKNEKRKEGESSLRKRAGFEEPGEYPLRTSDVQWSFYPIKIKTLDGVNFKYLVDDMISPDEVAHRKPKPRIVLNVDEITWEIEDLLSSIHRLHNEFKWCLTPHCIKLTLTALNNIGESTIQTMNKKNVITSSGEKCDSYLEFKKFAKAEVRLPHVWQINIAKVGLSEALIICFIAHKNKSPVWLYGDGLGLGEMGQHVQLWNAICLLHTNYRVEDHMIEFVNYQHGYFENPVFIRHGCYMPPTRPGFSTKLKDKCISRWSYPNGTRWKHLIKTKELRKV